MAKEQKRSNREVKKPKASKQPAAVAASAAPGKGMLGGINNPKKKK